MKPKTIILMVVAVVCGLAASYMTSRLLADRNPAPAPVATVKVLVSKQKIAAWTPIKDPESLFEEKEVPEGTYPGKSIADFKDLRDQSLKLPLNEGLPLTKDDLLTADSAGLVYLLKPGMRAIALRVNPETLVGGFVLPTSKVDVICTLHRGDADSTAETIMQDMLVLAVDQMRRREDGKDAVLASTVTLAANPNQAQRLALAAELGQLRLVLRTPADPDILKIKATRIGDIAKNAPPPQKDNSVTTNDSGDSGLSTGGTGDLPPLPKVEPKPEPKPEPEPVVVVKAPRTHTLKIESGDSMTKSVFVWDEKSNDWVGGERSGDARPKPAPAPKPDATKDALAPKPAEDKAPAKPADAEKAPQGPVG